MLTLLAPLLEYSVADNPTPALTTVMNMVDELVAKRLGEDGKPTSLQELASWRPLTPGRRQLAREAVPQTPAPVSHTYGSLVGPAAGLTLFRCGGRLPPRLGYDRLGIDQEANLGAKPTASIKTKTKTKVPRTFRYKHMDTVGQGPFHATGNAHCPPPRHQGWEGCGMGVNGTQHYLNGADVPAPPVMHRSFTITRDRALFLITRPLGVAALICEQRPPRDVACLPCQRRLPLHAHQARPQ